VPTQTGGKIDKIYMGKCNKDDPKYIENCDVKAGNYVWVNTALQMMDNPLTYADSQWYMKAATASCRNVSDTLRTRQYSGRKCMDVS